MPLIAVTGNLTAAGLLYNGERVGKAVRTLARGTMLAHASAEIGRGYAFGLHEALDQIGAMTGPLLISATLALGGTYHLSFALLAVPGGLALFALARLRRAAPDPTVWEPAAQVSEKSDYAWRRDSLAGSGSTRHKRRSLDVVVRREEGLTTMWSSGPLRWDHGWR